MEAEQEMSNGKRFWDLMQQTPLIVGFLALEGLVSYFVIMLLRWIEELMGAVSGMLHTALVGVDVALGIVLCVFAMYIYMRRLGANDVTYLESRGADPASLTPVMGKAAVAFAVGFAVFGAVLYLLGVLGWEFFSGPVAYMAAALNFRWGTGEPNGPMHFWCRLVGFAVYAAAVFPAMLLGYKKGFEERLASKTENVEA